MISQQAPAQFSMVGQTNAQSTGGGIGAQTTKNSMSKHANFSQNLINQIGAMNGAPSGQAAAPTGQKRSQSHNNDGRVQKDVIIRRNSSKSLLQNQINTGSNMPAIPANKAEASKVQTPARNASGSGAPILLKTESMDRETANTSKVGGATSHHKCELSSLWE